MYVLYFFKLNFSKFVCSSSTNQGNASEMNVNAFVFN